MVRDQTKILLVTADDFGLCRSVTDGILDACSNGIVRATSLFAIGEDAARAAKLSRSEPQLHVGVHLALVDGRPISPAAEVSSLIDDRGAFWQDHAQFVRRYLLRRIDLAQIEREWRAQLAAVRSWGISPSHLDSHQHLHLLPGIFEIALRLCREFAVPRLRVTSAGIASLRALAANAKPGQGALELLSWRAARLLKRHPQVRMCERFLGRGESCRLSQSSLLTLIDEVRPGTQELMCHPGAGDGEDLRRHPFGENWTRELSALKSAAVRTAIVERGIVLVGTL